MLKVVSEFDRLKGKAIKCQFKIMGVEDMDNMEHSYPQWSPSDTFNKQIKFLPS